MGGEVLVPLLNTHDPFLRRERAGREGLLPSLRLIFTLQDLSSSHKWEGGIFVSGVPTYMSLS